MGAVDYPKTIRDLPEAEIPLEGVRGWILQGLHHQVVFFDIDAIGVVPEHVHGEQWGVVIDGVMDLTIAGETRTYRKGETYSIPAGAPHSALFRTRFKAVDFFADPERYRPRSTPA